jgi:photosystem II stability/assembly factor-like uncharacterized protein
MRFLPFRILSVGLAVLLVMPACSVVSPASPTRATLPPAEPSSEAVSPVPATVTPPLPASTASSIPNVPPLPAASSPSIRSLDMLDANNGWASTDAGVLRTLDGGSSWYDATPAGLNGAPFSSFFLNSSTAWLAAMGADPASGSLYHTTDGGATWASASVPFGGGSLHFVDAMNGWELIGLGAGMSHEAVAVYRTSDGGMTWSKVFTDDPNAPDSSDSLPFVGDKNGITATDSDHAWVTGAQPSENFIYIYTTLDGGTTWAHQDVSLPDGYTDAMTNPALPVFLTANEAVLPVLLYAKDISTVFYVSHDGGQSWSATTLVAQSGNLAVASARDFFIWDGGAALSVSHDAGTTWSTVTPNVNLKDTMALMQFVDIATGWALSADANGHTKLYKTVDGGATWTVLIP